MLFVVCVADLIVPGSVVVVVVWIVIASAVVVEHYDKVFHAQELGSYAQGQGSLAVFKVTARDQGHYKGPSGAFVTYCNISCLYLDSL